jgi:hypothetical protein
VAAAVNEKELAERLQAGLAKPLGAALQSAVERQLLPPLERAVGEAFRQVLAAVACPLCQHVLMAGRHGTDGSAATGAAAACWCYCLHNQCHISTAFVLTRSAPVVDRWMSRWRQASGSTRTRAPHRPQPSRPRCRPAWSRSGPPRRSLHLLVGNSAA